LNSISAHDAKNGSSCFDLGRAVPVTVANHGRPSEVEMVVEDFERLKSLDPGAAPPTHATPEIVVRRK
jgi:hypothetical protein